MNRSDAELKPKNGHTLQVGIVARISGCQNQKELSLEDQEDHGEEIVADRYDGPVEFRVIATKGKGERLDRPELAEIEAMLRRGDLDLLVMEDVGRMVRGSEAVRLWGIAVDHGVRCLAPNDNCDTADDNWEQNLLNACAEHVAHNAHTSLRIKYKKMNHFKKFGGATPCEIFGYLKPPGAKTYDDWQKLEEATPVIQEGLRRLKETLNCSAVADWLNQQGVPVGKYCDRKQWYGAMVRRYYGNPLLKGQPGRGFRRTIKHHETGRRISVPNPKGAIFRDCPHLIHIDPVEFDEVNALLKAKNDKYHRKRVNGVDPLWRVSRKRTVFPGQHARCWYCGSHVVWGANGVTENLMCSASREWHCWNSVGFPGPLTVERLTGVITGELYTLSGFDDQFRELVELARENRGGGQAERWQKLRSDEEALAREKENFNAAIARYGLRPEFDQRMQEIDERKAVAARERYALEQLQQRALWLPKSTFELRQMLEEKFQASALESSEFGDLMRILVPEFYVYLVRLLDGGHPLPRAKVRLNLGAVVPDIQHVPDLERLLTREVTLDLFEKPPQRERIREVVVRLAAEHVPQRRMAERMPDENPKLPVIQAALALDRLMKEQRCISPYVVLTEPPEDYPKLRRHRNPKYCFKPREGYQRPSL